MSEHVIAGSAPMTFDMHRHMRKTRGGKIKTKAISKSGIAIQLTVLILLALTFSLFETNLS